MNTTQTSLVPTLSPAAHALLADFADPDLSELDLARRHDLTLDQLRSAARAPAFRRALAAIRELQDLRRPLILARAEAEAARTLTALAARPPTSATAAKESRLATKDLLRILGAGGFQPPDRAQPDPSYGGADFQSAIRAQPEPPEAPNAPTLPNHPSGGVGGPPPHPPPPPGGGGATPPTPQPTTLPSLPAQTRVPSPHEPKRPRNTKPRPKPRSR